MKCLLLIGNAQGSITHIIYLYDEGRRWGCCYGLWLSHQRIDPTIEAGKCWHPWALATEGDTWVHTSYGRHGLSVASTANVSMRANCWPSSEAGTSLPAIKRVKIIKLYLLVCDSSRISRHVWLGKLYFYSCLMRVIIINLIRVFFAK